MQIDFLGIFWALDTVCHTWQKYINPGISVPCALTQPNLGYDQSHPSEVHQSMVKWPTNPWVGGLLLGVTDDILGKDRIGHTAH
jgi:hypothetical protein